MAALASVKAFGGRRKLPKRVAICLWPADFPAVDPARQAFIADFADQGLVDGRDVEIVVIRARSHGIDDTTASVRHAIDLGSAVILVHADGPTAKEFYLPLTRNIPLVVWGAELGADDSLEALNRRGENVTGAMYSYVQLVGKRLELMKELRPGARRAALVGPQSRRPATEWSKALKRRVVELHMANARRLGLDLVLIEVPGEVSGQGLVRTLQADRIELAEISVYWSGLAFWEPLARNGIAASSVGANRARDGALVGGWSAGFEKVAVRLAARILRGERAAAVPVERPMEYGIAINLRTAALLGLAVPPSIRMRADQVFE